jgi:acyl-CoA synthetase (AMP-forming)/AMP-acid ligase II
MAMFQSQVDAITDEKLTRDDFVRHSYKLAAELQELGCREGTIVGIMSENRLEYPIAILGTTLTGAAITCYISEFSVCEYIGPLWCERIALYT